MIRSIVCILAVVAVATAAGAESPATAPRTLTVSGTGTVKSAPDEAGFSTGVVSQAPTAGAALAANTRAMRAVIATLQHQGVSDKAIQTSDLSLTAQYQTCKPGVACAQRVVSYEVSNTVSVTVGLDKAGAVLDALVSSGANQIGGIAFAIHDPKPLLAAARTEAVKDAVAKAEAYAKAAGVSLGPILAIQDSGSEPSRPLYRSMNKAMALAETPIVGGEQALTAAVSITWQIN